MTTLFFNSNLLLTKAKNNPDKIVELLQDYYVRKIDKKYIPLNLAGKSFLLNPNPLFMDVSSSIHKSQYIILAGKRDLFLYRTYNYTGLQLSFFPDLNLDTIKNNPLLTITKSEIKFKYEG